MTRKIALLGSTGSIGRQTLEVVAEHPEHFEIVALAAGKNLELLEQQVQRFRPRLVSVDCPVDRRVFPESEVMYGEKGLMAAATITEADIVVVATSGHAAIAPTLAAIRDEKTIALSNKEAIVCAGAIIVPEAQRRGVEIRPVDSEHSAIWQCLAAPHMPGEVSEVVLTASGGPFLDTPLDRLSDVTIDQALAHPNWRMGTKVTIDSATMMNKGLEVIEAHWLFGMPYEQIGVVIHPQSIVHSLVGFKDGSVLAQLAVHDMRVPIQYALSFPERLATPARALDIASLGALEFRPPESARFPALALARWAGETGGTYPTVLSSADEVAVDAFLAGRIGFVEIATVVETVLDRHEPASGAITLETIAAADHWARREAARVIANRSDFDGVTLRT